MDKREADFSAKLIATYKVESEEHLKNLSDGLLALESNPPENKQKELIEKIFREAHSLKGASRAVNFHFTEQLCQVMENVLSAWKRGQLSPFPQLFDTFYVAIDWIGKFIRQTDAIEKLDAPRQFQALLEQLKQIEQNPSSSDLAQQKPSSTLTEFSETQEAPGHEKDQTIRVSISKLDRLLQQAEEMLVLKLTAAQHLYESKEIIELAHQWDKEWNKMQMTLHLLSSPAQPTTSLSSSATQQLQDFLNWQPHFLKNFKAKLESLIRTAAQDDRVITGLVDNLLDDTKSVLMQPFSTLLEVFPRMVRDISHSLGKDIHLHMNGGETEVDRRILEELKDPLIHLIRNSIDHGIESPEERVAQHKPAFGLITLTASQVSGNSVEVSVSDDGRGIDVEKVKQSAIKQGALTDKDAQQLSVEQALLLIFQSGLSTSQLVTELSGRGLGMGIVSEKVEKLGGRIFIETKLKIGTTFRLVLPLTLATFRGIHVRTANQEFIIPTQSVKRVVRLFSPEVKTLEGQETIIYEGRVLSYLLLEDLLQLSLPPSSPKKKEANNPHLILIVKAADTLLAIGVDQILSEQEVLVKGLGKQLARVQNVSASTILESGRVIPILDPFDLIKTATKRGSLHTQHLTQPPLVESTAPLIRKTILIAEDSMTARILLQNILESAGYEVKTAQDGLEAFTLLKTEKVDLLLTDVEMPHMTGFELTAKIRENDKLKELPIVLCTTRGSKEDRELGIEVGANAYINKNRFIQSNLLDIIQRLL